jgi:hypothetical protein
MAINANSTIIGDMMNTTMDTAVTHKCIPAQFNKKGFTYTQLKREGNRAIFQQTRAGSSLNNYEVVKIGRHNGYIMGGVTIEPAETYPGSSLWGITAWTCTSIDQALQRYEMLDK